jgi:hypothetical protein
MEIHRTLHAAALILALSPLSNTDAASITAVPPAVYMAPRTEVKAATSAAPAAPASIRIVLATPSADEAARSTSERPAGGRPQPPVIGFGRELPDAQRSIDLASLAWVASADGRRSARVELTSPGAVALRLSLAFEPRVPDVVIRSEGSGIGAEAFGADASTIAAEIARGHVWWTPVLEGERAIVTIDAAPGADLAGIKLLIPRISHLTVAGQALSKSSIKALGDAGSCNVDVACLPSSSALTDTANAVGRIVLTKATGQTVSCTGTMLNDSVRSFTPYFFSAAHCIDSAVGASSLNVYWFFRASSCGARTAPDAVLQTGGATLLARSDDWDWALVRLNAPPPSGTRFSAWRAEFVPLQSSALTVHHPRADVAKYSQGTAADYVLYDDGSSFVAMRWAVGTTEPGSSGAGLFTFNGTGGYHELRGGLFAGRASCSNPGGFDEFSRLDVMLPLTREYLTPDAPDNGSRVIVAEFYNRALDHYFISTDPAEMRKLDTGEFKGWERTGFRFIAYSGPVEGASPVCRFYMRPEVGDSHFYSGDPGECAETERRFGASWIYESPNVFYIPMPDRITGACPARTRPVWRFLNLQTTNHRYTIEVLARDLMRASPRWKAEGYGPDDVIMCSPE